MGEQAGLSPEQLHQAIDALREEVKNHPDPLRLNGKKQLLLWGGGGGLMALLTSVLTFWLGFYPTIATTAYVDKHFREGIAKAGITREADLRISAVEGANEKLDTKLDKLRDIVIENQIELKFLIKGTP